MCTKPIRAYQNSGGSVFFSELSRHGEIVRNLWLPCGQCWECRLERSRQWAVRCMHEAQMHEASSFVTLTYCQTDLSLHYEDFQKFIRRMRKEGFKLRFYMCGEYGEENGRPHYHALLFGVHFVDRYYWRTSAAGFKLYRSPVLERLWSHGNCEIGDVTFESAAYVARYCMKKLTGDGNDKYYNIFDVWTGEIFPRLKEFSHMSLKPGIGRPWLDKFHSDVYPDGRCVVRGVKCKPPKFYDKRFEALCEDDSFAAMQLSRERYAQAHACDNTDERLSVRDTVLRARTSFLKREM